MTGPDIRVRGRVYEPVDSGDVAPGDVVAYIDHGRRMGRVMRVSKEHVTVGAVKYAGVVVRGQCRVHRRNIVGGWRRREKR